MVVSAGESCANGVFLVRRRAPHSMSPVQEKSKTQGIFSTECVLHSNHSKSKALNNFPSCLSCCLAGSLLPFSLPPRGKRLVAPNFSFSFPPFWVIHYIKHTRLNLFYFLIKQIKCYTYSWIPFLFSMSLFYFVSGKHSPELVGIVLCFYTFSMLVWNLLSDIGSCFTYQCKWYIIFIYIPCLFIYHLFIYLYTCLLFTDGDEI